MTRIETTTHRRASLHGAKPGPTVIAIGAIHGNEPAGLIAAERIAREARIARGSFHAVVGNRTALAAGTRFIDGDLNRRFVPHRISAARDPATRASDSEDAVQQTLLSELDALVREAAPEHPVVILDLHTFSAPGTPFAMASPHALARRLARAVPMPILLGLEDHLRGTVVELGIVDGLPVLAMEGGQHDAPESISVLGAAIVGVLGALEMGLGEAPFEADAQAHATESTYAIRYRHAITPDDAFVMRPGYTNLAPVARDAHLADDRHGPVLAPMDGHIVMPLYQGLGSDGFFMAVRVDD